MDEIEENSNISAKNEESKSNHDFSNKKGEKNNKKNKKIKKLNKANNSPKKELRKINKEKIKNSEKKNKLIKPKMFEADLFPIKNIQNIIPKIQPEFKPIIQFPNNFQKIDLNFNNLINNDFPKNLNIFSENNYFKPPIIGLNENKINNNFISGSTTTSDYKQKFFPPKPLNTFTVFKLEEKNENKLIDSKLNTSIGNNNSSENKNFVIKNKNTRKGRKSKKLKKVYYESKHTKFSEDNMMRKIKNKIIESSRLLTNRFFFEELKVLNDKYCYCCKEFRKIKGSFSQELNIKFNLYFYSMKIKDIFSLELSHKYTSVENNSNKELIDYIFSEQNKNYYPKTKQILDMPFHQYYHDIFLGEDKTWKLKFGIDINDDRYQLENVLKSLEEKTEENDIIENNDIYAKNICTLAHHYEDFFLSKKTRNVELGNKKEDCIKSFMENTTEEQYKSYMEQLKQFKKFYETRSGFQEEQKLKNPFILKYNYPKKDNLNINEINNNNFYNLTSVKFKIDTPIKNQVNDKENENKLNVQKSKPEILFKVNIEKGNDFCGKKRNFDTKIENIDINKDMKAIEI